MLRTASFLQGKKGGGRQQQQQGGLPRLLVVLANCVMPDEQAASPQRGPLPTADECRRQHICLCPHVRLPLDHIKQPVATLLIQRLGVGKPPAAAQGQGQRA